jgi:hypothetical protein
MPLPQACKPHMHTIIPPFQTPTRTTYSTTTYSQLDGIYLRWGPIVSGCARRGITCHLRLIYACSSNCCTNDSELDIRSNPALSVPWRCSRLVVLYNTAVLLLLLSLLLL